MKILLLGYPDYLSKLLFFLKDSAFLRKNEINIIFPFSSSNNNRFNFIKLLKKTSFIKIFTKIHLSIFKKRHQKIINILFPSTDLEFLDSYDNINISKVKSLHQISDLCNYDYMIVASYGEKINYSIFSLPKNGTLNVHPSFLPNLRGGYPTYVEAYIGSSTGGTTIHQMDKNFDTGNIVIQEDYKAEPLQNNDDRYKHSAEIAAKLFNKLQEELFYIQPVNQTNTSSTYCHKVLKPKRELSSMNPNDDIKGYIRANYAKHLYPFTHSIVDNSLFSILEVIPAEENNIIHSRFVIYKNQAIIFKFKSTYYLNFFGNFYKITCYIKNGILYNQSQIAFT
jgi:methionyl-tRNA formyltransferase